MIRKYTGIFQHVGEWWIGWAEELPGANTQGRSLEEARENLLEAIQLMLEMNRERSEEELDPKAEVIRGELAVSVP